MPDKSAAVTLGRGERAALAGSSGTTTTRIGALSQRPFDACWLCNRDAVEPLSTGEGLIYCRECIFNNILAQKKKLKAMKKAKKKKAEAEADEAKTRIEQQKDTWITAEGEHTDVVKARPAQNNFWLAHMQPEARKKDVTIATVVSDPFTGAPLKLSLLNDIVWQYEDEAAGGKEASVHVGVAVGAVATPTTVAQDLKRKECKGCRRAHSNGKRLVLLQPCGHVLCHGCFERFVNDEQGCLSCDAKVDRSIELRSGGTSFASTGNVESSMTMPVARI